MLKVIIKGGALLFCIFVLTACGDNGGKGTEKGADDGTELVAGDNADVLSEDETQAVVLKLAEMHVADHPITQSLVYFADEVEERTEGRVEVDVCPAGILGTENSTFAKVCNGSVDLARVSSITVSEYSHNFTPLALPYIFDSREHMWNVVTSPMGDEMLANIDGCQGLAWIENGARCFYSNTPIYSPADMKGKKFRVPNSKTMYAMLNYYDAIPMTIDFSFVYKAIQNGEICGAENDIISYERFANSVVARYFVRNNHSFAPSLIVASNSLKEKIGEQDYNILLQCAKDAQSKSYQYWDEAEKLVVEELSESGVQIIQPNSQHLAEFKAAGSTIFANYPQYTDVIKEIQSMK